MNVNCEGKFSSRGKSGNATRHQIRGFSVLSHLGRRGDDGFQVEKFLLLGTRPRVTQVLDADANFAISGNPGISNFVLGIVESRPRAVAILVNRVAGRVARQVEF